MPLTKLKERNLGRAKEKDTGILHCDFKVHVCKYVLIKKKFKQLSELHYGGSHLYPQELFE